MTRRPFTRLAGAATISGLADGVTQVADALLTLSLTRSPLLVAGLLAARQLPWALGRCPPAAMLGRVQGAYWAVSNGGLLAGAALSGLLTSAVSLTAPL
jgi:hypothetical protein